MLHEAGIMRSECFVTNVCRVRPPGNDIAHFIAMRKKDVTPQHVLFRDRYVLPVVVDGYRLLVQEIEAVQPNVIIAFGNVSMWSLTGRWGISKWRGSQLRCEKSDLFGFESGAAMKPPPKVIPTLHPAAVLRQWSQRHITVQDLRRAARHADSREYAKREWNLIVRPSFETAAGTLDDLLEVLDIGPLDIEFDLETRAGHIACAGLSWSDTDAICIPLMCVERRDGYWSEEEEAQIVWLLYRVLTHCNARIRGQNLLYDSQYTWRHWHFVPRVVQDTMVSHHTAFPELKKALDFQASLYCEDYVYWKDDGKEWDKHVGEDQLWTYNCEDCLRTREVANATADTVKSLGLDEPHAFQQRLFWAALRAMQLGVRTDRSLRARFAMELQEEIAGREQYFLDVLGHTLNPRSPVQMQRLFYDDLRIKPVISRKTGNPTCDDDALDVIGKREPMLLPLLKKIAEYRSLGVFLSTFVNAPLDSDDRIRSSFNICGTVTFRLSSSQNAFGSGLNMQNIPKGTEAKEPEDLELPNVRKLFIPDPGYTFFDMDLDRADLQVVVWEADDAELKAMLREGVDIHTENAKLLGISRQLAKSWVHGTNYGGSPRTMAINCGIPVHQAERMRSRWMSAHPGILKWHQRTEASLRGRMPNVSNRFGYRRYFFDRTEGLLPEALAWIPQSSVACLINRAWVNLYENFSECQVLIQVHDSLAGQFPTHRKEECLRKLRELSSIVIPYEDPLIIPVGIKTSETSWGDCE